MEAAWHGCTAVHVHEELSGLDGGARERLGDNCLASALFSRSAIIQATT
jgi:hypothetical protein